MKQPSIILGAMYTTLAMTAVVLMAAIVKWASHGFSSEFLMLVRWGTGLAVFVAFYLLTRQVSLRTSRWLVQSGVAVCWTAAIFLYYLSLRYIPLMDATLLLNTAALFAPLLAWIFTGQREPPLVWVGLAIGFIGVLIVLRPGPEMFQPMALVALASGWLMAMRIFLISQLGDEPKQRTTFYSLAVGLGVILLLLASTGFPIARPGWEEMLFTPSEMAQPLFVDTALIAAVVILGVMSLLQPLLTAWSLDYASVGQIGPFRYTAVIMAAVIDWLVWNQLPTWTGISGLLLIGFSGIVVVLASRWQRTVD